MTQKALLAAINNYADPRNNLPSCIEDAVAFKKILIAEYGFRSSDIKMITDAEVTANRMKQELDWLFNDVQFEDRLFLFYSGHGYQKKNEGVLEEVLVLHDSEFFNDDELLERTQSLPPGVLTVVLDSCFSGGMQKYVRISSDSVESVKTKVWTPPEFLKKAEEEAAAKLFATGEPKSIKRKQFGRPVSSEIAEKAVIRQPSMKKYEDGQETLNGLLLSACLEDETASASSSKTEEMSAFTFSIVSTIGKFGADISGGQLISHCASFLREKGFRQTPLALDPAKPNNLSRLSFVRLNPAKDALSTSIPLLPNFPVVPSADIQRLLDAIMSSYFNSSGQKGITQGGGEASPKEPFTVMALLGGVAAAAAPVLIQETFRLVNSMISGQKGMLPGMDSGQKFFDWGTMINQAMSEIVPVVAQAATQAVTQAVSSMISGQKGIGVGVAPQKGFEVVTTEWWGVKVYIDNNTVIGLTSGGDAAVQALASLPVPPWIAPLISAAVGWMRAVNPSGKGIYFICNWAGIWWLEPVS